MNVAGTSLPSGADGAGPPGPGGASATPPKNLVLVIGPADLLAAHPPIRLGVVSSGEGAGPAAEALAVLAPPLGGDLVQSDPLTRDTYVTLLAEAIANGVITAALVEIDRPAALSPVAGAAAASGGPAIAVGAAGLGAVAGAGGGEGIPGGDAAPGFDLPLKTPVPLAHARALSADEFRERASRMLGQ